MQLPKRLNRKEMFGFLVTEVSDEHVPTCTFTLIYFTGEVVGRGGARMEERQCNSSGRKDQSEEEVVA